MAEPPPAYQDASYNDIPSYSDTARRSGQWRIVTSLNQKKRFITIAPVSDARPEDSEGSGQSSYKIGFNHPLQLQARGFHPGDPNGNCFEGPNGSAGSHQSIVANIELSTQHPSLGDIAFVEPGRDQNVFIDAKDVFNSVASSDPLTSQKLYAYLTYHEASQKMALPVLWKIEPRHVQDEEPVSETNDNPIIEEKKKSFWKMEKDSSKHKHKKSKPDPTLERQKAILNSTFRLCDDDGNVYATFESDFYSQSPTPLPKGFEFVSATHRSWGTISLRDPGFNRLRSQMSFFEKWSDDKLEQLVLISLVSCLEINLRLQGGSDGKAFVGALTMSAVMGSVFGAEGLVGVADAVTSGLAKAAGGGFRMGGLFQ